MTERIPAGWYPDPAGLPQLRWWDNHQWTEHTSDAREPLVAAETETAARVAKESPAPTIVDEPVSVVVTRETRSIASMVEDVAAAPAAAPRAAVDLGARFDAQLAGTPTANVFAATATATATATPTAPPMLHEVPQPSMTQPPVIVPPQPETIHVEPTIHRGFEPEPVFAGFGGSSVVDGESLGEALHRMFRTAR